VQIDGEDLHIFHIYLDIDVCVRVYTIHLSINACVYIYAYTNKYMHIYTRAYVHISASRPNKKRPNECKGHR